LQDSSWDTQLASDYSIWDSTFSLLNTAQFTAENYTYSCTSYDTSCDAFFPTHPVFAQPFLPVIPKLLQGKIFTYLETKAIYSQLTPSIYIQKDYERLYPSVSHKQLKYFFVLSSKNNGVPILFHSSRVLSTGVLRILGNVTYIASSDNKGGVSNSANEPFIATTELNKVTSQSNCDYNTYQLVNEIFSETIAQLESLHLVGSNSLLTPSLR
jgi:hypothetical protein